MNTRKRPWCLVQPHDTEEVAKTIIALLEAGDGAGNWHIAVRSGGHSLGTANNIDSGVTIDLGKMNQTTYNRETNLASIGPGGKWGDVYEELHKHGVIVTGGRDGSVGVGGFLLGGGLTYFIGRQGFACDSVKNFEVVLANGTIINANNKEHPDLWKALKGGGNNFGIVTRFDMEALPDKELTYGLRFMHSNHTPGFVDAVMRFTDQFHEFDHDALVPFLMHDTDLAPFYVLAAIHVNTQGLHDSPGFEKLMQIPAMTPDKTESVPLFKAAPPTDIGVGTW
jgi:FAD/FMN-containing dehydrogenase